MKPASILVVDDERAVRVALEVNLTKAGHTVSLAESGQRALSILRSQEVDVVLTDFMMPEMTGIELLAEIRERWPLTQVVLMTGHGTVERAVEAMRLGAHDFVIKPVGRDELLAILDRAVRERGLHKRVARLEAEASERFGFDKVIGNSASMQRMYDQVRAVASSDAYVLLSGPTGTGKELVAHAIHHRSPRAKGPFVQVNCGALPSGLLESELFGHEKGSFTGAIRQHKGKFEQSDGGTLMLDELGEMPLETQVKLLRILESGRFQRVGGTAEIQVDVRVIAATNRTLREEVDAGRFREDLYYRLNVFEISLPPLRERTEDIPLLVDHFVSLFAKKHSKAVTGAHPEAITALGAHSWPGNVRELEHVVERAVILAKGSQIRQFDLPQSATVSKETHTLPPEGQTIADSLRSLERRMVIEALQAEQGVQARAARRLGVSRANLNYRIQKLGLRVKDIQYE
ncbi:MAG: sigma-54 dependent transcriptional regulator [Myxococcota bacterium]|nr:sigma-54 dependent transcriptional regulator [Myxococcota bacterium]